MLYGRQNGSRPVTMSTQFHEDLRRDDDAPRASERSFGILFAVVFAIITLWPLLSGETPRWWAGVIAAIFAAFALVRPQILKPLNSAWLAFGSLLHRIMSPLVLGLVYIIAVAPTGLFLRATGRDPLRLKMDRNATTYWQERDPPGPPPGSLKNQF